jgi:hypothetical protein
VSTMRRCMVPSGSIRVATTLISPFCHRHTQWAVATLSWSLACDPRAIKCGARRSITGYRGHSYHRARKSITCVCPAQRSRDLVVRAGSNCRPSAFQTDDAASLLPPAGPQAQGWTGKCKSCHCQCLARVEGSSSRHRPGQVLADLASRAKVVQTVMCSTFTREAKRYPEGGRRREDEPPGEGWRVRANARDDEHQGDEDLENPPAHPGLPPRTPLRMAPVARCFTPYRPTRTRQDLPCTSARNPAPRQAGVSLTCH